MQHPPYSQYITKKHKTIKNKKTDKTKKINEKRLKKQQQNGNGNMVSFSRGKQ